MKKIFLISALFVAFTMNAQQINKPIVTYSPNVIMDSNGNYRDRMDINTGKLYITKDNTTLPVYQTRTGKLYVITGISAKTGKPKRKYLKP